MPASPPDPAPAISWPRLGFLLLILAATAWLRYRLLGVALERDEGEYAYGARLLLDGIPPYQALYSMKLPGIYVLYAGLLTVFGASASGIHLGLLLVNLVTIWLVALLGRRVATPFAGLAGAAVFALLSMGVPVLGLFANTEHFVLPFALAGLLVLLRGLERNRWTLLLGAGLLLGCGFLVKQHAVAFLIWASLWLAVEMALRRRDLAGAARGLAGLWLGFAVPYGLTVLAMLRAGSFQQFWFWTVEYAQAYTDQVSWRQGWDLLRAQSRFMFGDAPGLWLACLWGAVMVGLTPALRRHAPFTLGFFLFSFLAVCPGLYFREHYFIFLLPAASILAGLGMEQAGALIVRPGEARGRLAVGVTVAVLCLGTSLWIQRAVLFRLTPEQVVRAIYWPNPFVESLAIADFLKKNTEPGDTVAVIGSEPQIYFYANRRSASGYIYAYPLMETHPFALEMQKNMIQEIERANPKYLVFVRVSTSWLQKPASHLLIYDWFLVYKERYEQAGMVEILPDGARYTWKPARKWPPATGDWIEILERKAGQGGG